MSAYRKVVHSRFSGAEAGNAKLHIAQRMRPGGLWCSHLPPSQQCWQQPPGVQGGLRSYPCIHLHPPRTNTQGVLASNTHLCLDILYMLSACKHHLALLHDRLPSHTSPVDSQSRSLVHLCLNSIWDMVEPPGQGQFPQLVGMCDTCRGIACIALW